MSKPIPSINLATLRSISANSKIPSNPSRNPLHLSPNTPTSDDATINNTNTSISSISPTHQSSSLNASSSSSLSSSSRDWSLNNSGSNVGSLHKCGTFSKMFSVLNQGIESDKESAVESASSIESLSNILGEYDSSNNITKDSDSDSPPKVEKRNFSVFGNQLFDFPSLPQFLEYIFLQDSPTELIETFILGHTYFMETKSLFEEAATLLSESKQSKESLHIRYNKFLDVWDQLYARKTLDENIAKLIEQLRTEVLHKSSPKKRMTAHDQIFPSHISTSASLLSSPILKARGSNKTERKTLFDYPPVEVANVITCDDLQSIRSINIHELLHKRFEKKSRSVTLRSCVRRVNNFSSWVVGSIVETESTKTRVSLVSWFIRLANELRYMNNFQSLIAIMGGLCNSAVSRLNQTWTLIPEDVQATFSDLQVLVDPSYNHMRYRKTIRRTQTSYIPCLGIVIRDMSSVEESPTFISDSAAINLKKLKVIQRIVKIVTHCQDTVIEFDPDQKNHKIREFLNDHIGKCSKLDDNQTHRLSFLIEAKRSHRTSFTQSSSPSSPPTHSLSSLSLSDTYGAFTKRMSWTSEKFKLSGVVRRLGVTTTATATATTTANNLVKSDQGSG